MLIKAVLSRVKRGLMEAYRSRPAYQQNDYIGWLTKAKRKETQVERLAQMLEEVGRGSTYMKMSYRFHRPPDEKVFSSFLQTLSVYDILHLKLKISKVLLPN
jgi:hypothetical protein